MATLVFRAEDKARFEEVRSGIKKIETRAAGGKYEHIKAGDTLTFSCVGETFTKTVSKTYHWPSIEVMFSEVPLKQVMPDVDTVEDVRARYASYPDYPEKIATHGILGFELE